MDPELLNAALLDALRRLGVALRFEELPEEARLSGGLCTIRGARTVIVAEGSPLAEQNAVLVGALRRLDHESIHLPPIVRFAIRQAEP